MIDVQKQKSEELIALLVKKSGENGVRKTDTEEITVVRQWASRLTLF